MCVAGAESDGFFGTMTTTTTTQWRNLLSLRLHREERPESSKKGSRTICTAILDKAIMCALVVSAAAVVASAYLCGINTIAMRLLALLMYPAYVSNVLYIYLYIRTVSILMYTIYPLYTPPPNIIPFEHAVVHTFCICVCI